MKLKRLSHLNRRNCKSTAEQVFLSLVKSRFTKRFRRNFKYQAVLGNMIVDFWFKLKALVVEIDGPEHDPERDKRRDYFLAKHGLITLRLTNKQVIENPQESLDLVMSYPDVYPTHAVAAGKVYRLLMGNKFKSVHRWC